MFSPQQAHHDSRHSAAGLLCNRHRVHSTRGRLIGNFRQCKSLSSLCQYISMEGSKTQDLEFLTSNKKLIVTMLRMEAKAKFDTQQNHESCKGYKKKYAARVIKFLKVSFSCMSMDSNL